MRRLEVVVGVLLCAVACSRKPDLRAAGVVCWGNNATGQLGAPTESQHLIPQPSFGPSTALFAGAAELCGRFETGWKCQGNGSESWPASMLGSDVVQHATGTLFHCALTLSGTVLCEGGNLRGQLGRGHAPDPEQKVAIDPNTGEPLAMVPGARGEVGKVAGIDDATQLVAGVSHACVLRKSGEVWCWGVNDAGELGTGESGPNQQSATPVQVKDLRGVKLLGAGGRETCALLADGTVKCWGTLADSRFGEEEKGINSPALVEGVTGATSLAVSGREVCARATGGTFCWNYGRPATVRPDLAEATDVVLGWEHGCALVKEGAVACWGSNMRGEQGRDVTSSPVVTATPIPGLKHVTALTSAGGHICARLAR